MRSVRHADPPQPVHEPLFLLLSALSAGAETQAGPVTVRFDRATIADLPAIVDLLRDDVLGAAREGDDPATYESAFAAIDADPAHLLLVARDGDEVVATMQLTLLPSLSRGGALRMQIEAVRVAASHRGSGLGAELFVWAHEWGRTRGATLAQLTTDKSRVDAHRFYERLGYVPSHEGLKRPL